MRHIQRIVLGSACVLTTMGAMPAGAESTAEMLARVRAERLAARAAAAAPDRGVEQTFLARLNTPVSFDLKGEPLRTAVRRWSVEVGVPVVVFWRVFEAEGIDPETPVTLEVDGVAADKALLLLLSQVPDTRFVCQLQPYGVRVQTRTEANRDVVVRVYPVGDLTMPIPSFKDAPVFDLSAALESSGEGGGELFREQESDTEDQTPTRAELGEQLIEAITSTIEPELWENNGGEVASIRLVRRQLVVRAPRYVHALLAQRGE